MTHDITKLDWRPHKTGIDSGEMAVVDFPNGYSASCLRGGDRGFYTDGGTYEIAVMTDLGCCYDTPVTDDVLGYLTEAEANKALADIEALPDRTAP